MDRILTWMDTGIVAINGDVPFKEVNAELGEYCLPVEPLSAQKTISQFIKEGGIGYNSLQKKTLGFSIYQFCSTFSGKKFTYGSKYETLYNAGYPLHRIIEGPLFSEELSQNLGRIEHVVLSVKKAEDVEVSFHNGHLDQLHISDHASNAFFINEFGAEILGLEGEGIVKTYKSGSAKNRELEKEIWERRFIEDRIPADHSSKKFVIMKSRLAEIFKIFNENTHGLFFALRVHHGILILMSGEKRQLDTVGKSIRHIPLTFEIRAIK